MARRRKSLKPFRHGKARKRPYASGSVREKRRVAQRGIERTIDVLFLPLAFLAKASKKGRKK